MQLNCSFVYLRVQLLNLAAINNDIRQIISCHWINHANLEIHHDHNTKVRSVLKHNYQMYSTIKAMRGWG